MTAEGCETPAEEEKAANNRLDPKASFATPATSVSLEQDTDVIRDREKEVVDTGAIILDGSADTGTTGHYSVFTKGQKRAIILSGSFFGLLSYMAGSIYYPAVNQISRDLHVSVSKINLTVTTYLIAQGIAPVMIAEFSERAGRRPAYLICFFISIVANLGLALQNDYYALLFLRMLQSAGSSGTLSQGLVGDCIVSAERGKYIAYTSVATILGPSLSPFLGGIISQYAGWHWIFWFLLIISVATFIPLALFLPETCRKVVGDGSIPPPWICGNISDSLRFKKRLSRGIPIDQEKQAELRANYRLAVPNPLSTLRILSDPESAILLISLSLAMACYYAIFTNISKNFHDLYGFSNLKISFVVLSAAGGSIVSSFTTGRLVDWNYRRHAKKLDFPVSRNHQTDLSSFPIEQARLEIGLPIMFLGAVGIIGYGWALNSGISVAAPITFLFFVGYGISATSQVLYVLMADIHPGKFAVAAAARNICQCFVGAATSAAIEPMSQAMGNGWAYTTLALLFLISLLGSMSTMKYGIGLRKKKRERVNQHV